MNSKQIERMTDLLLIKRASNLKKILDIKHRLQSIATIDGVEYINDSKSTYADATYYSLQNMVGDVVWIVDSRPYNQSLTELNDCVQTKVKKILAIGRYAEDLLSIFPNVKGVAYQTLEEALNNHSEIEPGDTVLYSPACPTDGRHSDFKQRGDEFIELVERLT